jgi:predicted AlkP superfamily phosphohydrolase/phosphomutase
MKAMLAKPAILIGLDAADFNRIERLSARGGMPNLAAILSRVVRGRLRSLPGVLSTMIWPK